MCRNSFKKTFILFMVTLGMMGSQMGYAQDPIAAKAEADGAVRYAMEYYTQANQLLSGNVSGERLRGAMQLFVQAGQLFEKAAKTYQSVGPEYASQADISNSAQLMQRCIDSVNKIKAQVSL